jgi:cytochrome-b5 reductase
VDGNVKIQAPFAHKKVCMLVGGTGITSIVQALHAILGDPTSGVEVVVLFGSRESRDFPGKDLLDSWVQQHPHSHTVEHILSDEPENANWAGARGHITKDLIEKHFPPPADNSMIDRPCIAHYADLERRRNCRDC